MTTDKQDSAPTPIAPCNAMHATPSEEDRAELQAVCASLSEASAPTGAPSDADLLWTMRHIEPHLKDVEGAIPQLLTSARALLARYGEQPVRIAVEREQELLDRQDALRAEIVALKGTIGDLEHRARQPAASVEPVAQIYRKGFQHGSIVWTASGLAADLPDGTNLYAAPVTAQAQPQPSGNAGELQAEVSRLQKMFEAADNGMHAEAARGDRLASALRGMLQLDEENHQRYAGDEDVCKEIREARAALADDGGRCAALAAQASGQAQQGESEGGAHGGQQ